MLKDEEVFLPIKSSSGLENQSSNEIEAHLFSRNKKIKQIHMKQSKVQRWTPQEDSKLLEISEGLNHRNWKKVADQLPGRTHIQCSARYRRIKPGIIKGTWTLSEDHQLMRLVQTYGINWAVIAKHLPSRSSKQIRDRYLNTLYPGANKDKFTEEEDNIILNKYKEIGGKWTVISNFLNNRSSESIKNRFYTSIRIKHFKIDYVRQKRIRERIQTRNKIVEVSIIKRADSVSQSNAHISISSNLTLNVPAHYSARLVKDNCSSNSVKLIEKPDTSIKIPIKRTQSNKFKKSYSDNCDS